MSKNRLFRRGLAAGLGGFSLVAGLLALRTASLSTPELAVGLTAQSLPQGRSGAYYASVGTAALQAGNLPLAHAAAQLETKALPNRAGGWQRLAATETALAGMPTGPALKALTTAYDVSPYRPAEEMIWRVEFAARFWGQMPDTLGTQAGAQIEALAGLSNTWTVRSGWCWDLPESHLKDVACATRARDKAKSKARAAASQGE